MKSRCLIRVFQCKRSPPSRGAWIEIPTANLPEDVPDVAPLAGGVD